MFESLPADSTTYILQALNTLILVVRVAAVPAAVIYGLVLLRRIARNTAGGSGQK